MHAYKLNRSIISKEFRLYSQNTYLKNHVNVNFSFEKFFKNLPLVFFDRIEAYYYYFF